MQLVSRYGIQQKTFSTPDQDLSNDQGNKVMSEEQVQSKPQERLGEDVYANAGKQKGTNWIPPPKRISYDNKAFDDDGD